MLHAKIMQYPTTKMIHTNESGNNQPRTIQVLLLTATEYALSGYVGPQNSLDEGLPRTANPALSARTCDGVTFERQVD